MAIKVTIQDVAKKAGVSTATVSRVLSNNGYPVSHKLAAKIKQAVKELNYVPNLLGKQLKLNSNPTIGVIIPSISNPFYSSLMLGIEEVARKRRHHVMLCNTLQDLKIEEHYLNTLMQMQIKGLIISSIGSRPEQLDKLINHGLKIIALDQKIDNDRVAQIEFDYRSGGYLATRHLIGQGHRKIAYITAPLDRHSRRSIYQGYRDAMRDAGLAIGEGWVQEADEEQQIYDSHYEFNNGARLAGRLISQSDRPSAIFCCNDMTAIGAGFEISRRGLRVPEDISLMGFDDIPFAAMVTPPLSTIRQPDYDMGKLACHFLFDMIEDGERMETAGISLQPRLVERESVQRWHP